MSNQTDQRVVEYSEVERAIKKLDRQTALFTFLMVMLLITPFPFVTGLYDNNFVFLCIVLVLIATMLYSNHQLKPYKATIALWLQQNQ